MASIIKYIQQQEQLQAGQNNIWAKCIFTDNISKICNLYDKMLL